ncbi:hypothetical protein K7395_25985 [Streptomyces filamentosus]|uniref:Uncharacterized protein n=2 Tax=Streptomyces filamentosus TaxID=67294 RepID=A0ABY4V303_STRFL|nr:MULTISPECIES: hypothetical protein [Streptomyces]EFE74296.1 predicted protein [Streptomyces filamentosus NRRL 15998]ESU49824.1 hypothetical protein P376_2196 [Streptomyces sp. HCCB10043]EWS91434.1 hypothetical protein SSIG_01861 [Streptomyces filamentosus NRRL 11379]MYR78450.1 hypothetical protein [Streptomyces sp. SID5466]USC49925.1 hypothetical protein K7395_25985 [Streptomyces filamentosus]
MDTNTVTEEVAPTQGEEDHLLLSADTNGDGKPDVWMTDTTGDGRADLYQFDTTGDGTVEVTVVEGAEEPGTDRLVVEGDGGHPVRRGEAPGGPVERAAAADLVRRLRRGLGSSPDRAHAVTE